MSPHGPEFDARLDEILQRAFERDPVAFLAAITADEKEAVDA